MGGCATTRQELAQVLREVALNERLVVEDSLDDLGVHGSELWHRLLDLHLGVRRVTRLDDEQVNDAADDLLVLEVLRHGRLDRVDEDAQAESKRRECHEPLLVRAGPRQGLPEVRGER